jgi:hypothetical protein
MNRYFIFRKERNVNTEGMFKVLEKTDKERDDIIQMRIDDSNETDVYSKNKSKLLPTRRKFVIKRPRKLKVPKITIQENAASSVPEPEPEPETENQLPLQLPLP